MKIFIILILGNLIFGCATTFNPKAGECEDSKFRKTLIDLHLTGQSSDFFQCSYDRAKFQNDELIESEHQAKLKINPNYVEDERKKNLEIEREKILFRKRQAKAIEVGTNINEFLICFGEPTTKEMKDGDLIFWYDDPQRPTFFVFKNKKLSSILIDREMIKSRNDQERFVYQSAQAERQHLQNLNEAEASRRQAAWHHFLDSQTRTTSCHRNLDGSVECSSK